MVILHGKQWLLCDKRKFVMALLHRKQGLLFDKIISINVSAHSLPPDGFVWGIASYQHYFSYKAATVHNSRFLNCL